MRRRTKSRELALQILYQADQRGDDIVAEIDEMLDGEQRDPDVVAYARRIVAGVIETRDEIDRRLAETAEHWTIERMAVIDRNVLRLAVWELVTDDEEVPPKVVLNEAIELGKRFSTAQSGAFINGILDRIHRTLDDERGGGA